MEPRPLTTLWVTSACYRDSFTLLLLGKLKESTSSGFDSATFRLVASASTNYATACPPFPFCTLLIHSTFSYHMSLSIILILSWDLLSDYLNAPSLQVFRQNLIARLSHACCIHRHSHLSWLVLRYLVKDSDYVRFEVLTAVNMKSILLCGGICLPSYTATCSTIS
jgi:hypothetical protein